MIGRKHDSAGRRHNVKRAILDPIEPFAIARAIIDLEPLRPFLAKLRQRFPGTEIVEGDLFGGVATGLAAGWESVGRAGRSVARPWAGTSAAPLWPRQRLASTRSRRRPRPRPARLRGHGDGVLR